MDPELRKKIEAFNWADVQLYRALNNTLFERIRRAIGFEEELEWLRKEKERVSRLCARFVGWGDDKHRKAMLETDVDADDELCHILMMDSPGFVKFLKEKWGKKDPECHVGYRNSAVHVPTDNWGDTIFGSVLLRYAATYHAAAAVPKSGYTLGYPHAKTRDELLASMQRSTPLPRIIAGAKLFLDPAVLRSSLHETTIWPLIAHPATQLADTWTAHDVTALLQRTSLGRSVTLKEFVADATLWPHVDELPSDVISALRNPLNTQFADLAETPYKRAGVLMGRTDKVLIAEHLDESLVLMRRFVCWTLSDIVYTHNSTSPLWSMDAKLVEGAAAFNADDMVFYKELNESLWRGIGREISFNLELSNFRRMQAKMRQDCERFMAPADGSKTQEELVKEVQMLMQRSDVSSNERTCRLMQLGSRELLDVLRR